MTKCWCAMQLVNICSKVLNVQHRERGGAWTLPAFRRSASRAEAKKGRFSCRLHFHRRNAASELVYCALRFCLMLLSYIWRLF
jgi:hypothetical protein